VLAAGLSGKASWWHNNIPVLAEYFTVLVFDQRGTGRSSRVAVHSVEQMSADLIAILDAANLGRVAFLGHSTGGAIGVATALDYPDRLTRLAVYASTTCGDSYHLLTHLGAVSYARHHPCCQYAFDF
jgi:aminoacrylate hydrolase